MIHVVVYVLLCLVPALILLPLHFLDREPDNANTQEQGADIGGRAEMRLDLAA
jgi:hypothetical protein